LGLLLAPRQRVNEKPPLVPLERQAFPFVRTQCKPPLSLAPRPILSAGRRGLSHASYPVNRPNRGISWPNYGISFGVAEGSQVEMAVRDPAETPRATWPGQSGDVLVLACIWRPCLQSRSSPSRCAFPGKHRRAAPHNCRSYRQDDALGCSLRFLASAAGTPGWIKDRLYRLHKGPAL
jgi:hypothetical protein